jgi:transposase
MGETCRKFDKDFRESAVRLVRETGKPIAQVARGNSGNRGYFTSTTAETSHILNLLC